MQHIVFCRFFMTVNYDGLVKSHSFLYLSFLRKQESSEFK